MKKIIVFAVFLFFLGGCKKSIQQIQQDLVIQAMTDGYWKITNFTRNGTDITADYSAYKFKYYSNKTVDAIKNGTVEITGNWDGSATAMTTYANFSSPPYPIDLINGTWHINNNSWTFVLATQTVGSETRVMRLDKQ